jgi:hypothetical protein
MTTGSKTEKKVEITGARLLRTENIKTEQLRKYAGLVFQIKITRGNYWK